MPPKIWLRHADPGQQLDPKLKEAGEEVFRKVLPFRRDRLGDDTTAANAVEDAVRSASRFAASMRTPSAYLLTSVMRLIKRAIKRTPKTCQMEPARLEGLASTNPFAEIDTKLFCEKIRAQLSERDFAFLMSVLAKDCSWEQLGAGMGLSADAARKKYDRLIKNLREGLLHGGNSERQ